MEEPDVVPPHASHMADVVPSDIRHVAMKPLLYRSVVIPRTRLPCFKRPFALCKILECLNHTIVSKKLCQARNQIDFIRTRFQKYITAAAETKN